MTAALDRVLARCATDDNGCWVFGGYKVGGLYGRISVEGRQVLVHRFVFTEMVGDIPEGMELDHLCFVPACCNPDHLEVVTHEENQRRSRAGMRGHNVAAVELSKTHCPRNHAYDETNTYRNAKGHRWCRACRRERYLERTAA